jgi:hypothetical protein
MIIIAYNILKYSIHDGVYKATWGAQMKWMMNVDGKAQHIVTGKKIEY